MYDILLNTGTHGRRQWDVREQAVVLPTDNEVLYMLFLQDYEQRYKLTSLCSPVECLFHQVKYNDLVKFMNF